MDLVKALIMIGAALVVPIAAAKAQEAGSVELSAMRDAAKSYASAWLKNYADAVMATFVDEPVLSPSGLPYIEGQQAARDFWFPADYPPTTVTVFEWNDIEFAASGTIACVRGTFRLAFEYDGDNYENRGKYLALLRKGIDGGWRITHHFRDDLPLAA